MGVNDKIISEYQEFVKQGLKYKKPKISILIFGLQGELGSIYSCIKKRIRDNIVTEFSKQELKEEIGDALWYIAAICCKSGLSMEQVLISNLERIKNDPSIIIADNPHLKEKDFSSLRRIRIPTQLNSLNKYQNYAKKTSVVSCDDEEDLFKFCYPLTKITHDIYKLLYTKRSSRQQYKIKLQNRIGDLCWYLSMLAFYHNVPMNHALNFNVEKVSSMFGKKVSDMKHYFDEEFPSTEKLPRKFTAFLYNKNSNISYIVIRGLSIGDPLDDNSRVEDGYRYHDGIHFVLYALLGWSPVWRGFLHKKRKSKPDIDRVEDGARAKVVEEMVVKFIHSYFKEYKENQKSVDFSLLKNIRKITDDLEVKDVTHSQWEQVVFEALRIYGLLVKNDGGKLHVNLEKREIKYENLTSKEKKAVV